jgi:hypothetical protein
MSDVEDAAVQWVMAYERGHGREPVGHDLAMVWDWSGEWQRSATTELLVIMRLAASPEPFDWLRSA